MSEMIILSNGTEELNYDKFAIRGINVSIPSPSWATHYETVDVGYGQIPLDRKLDARPIDVRFLMRSEDFNDSYLLRDELYRLIAKEGYLYLSEKRQPGKRWKVYFEGMNEPERAGLHTMVMVASFVAPLGLSESVGTTLNKREFDENKWQFGQGLTFEDKEYVHSTNRFKIYNAGDVAIDPRKLPLKIIYRGASNRLTIKNHTNDTVWNYTGTSGANDSVTLDGIHSFKNDVSIFGSTNKQLVTLEKGWNDIELSGTSGTFLISFDFRFYFL